MKHETKTVVKKNEHGLEYLSVRCHYEDEESNRSQDYIIKCTKHARRRLQQRALPANLLASALHYAETYYRQGLIFHVVPGKKELVGLNNKLADRIRNTVIVTNSDTSEVITVYRTESGPSHIKKKAKELSRNAA